MVSAASILNPLEGREAFVTRDQLRRVMQVFVPTFLFCLFTQWLGLYVASFLLIAGFMWMVGRIALVEVAAHQLRIFDDHVRHLRHSVRRDHAEGAA